MSSSPRKDRGVLIAGNFLSPLGRNRSVCEDLADRLRDQGWHVVITSHKAGRFTRIVDMLGTAVRYRRDYKVAQIDLFSGLAFFWAVALGVLLRIMRKPFVLTLHGGNLPAFSRKWPRLVGWLLRSAAVVTAPSGYLADALRSLRADIQILPNAIDVGACPFRLRNHATPTIAWVRAFHEIYRPALAVEALAKLAAEFGEARLIMAGPDKDGSLQTTKALADSLGLSGRIEYTGGLAKADVPLCINRADIFLNTSAVDNYPVTLLEAMACGACVVTTPPGGIAYMVNDGENGLLVANADAAGVASKMAEVLWDDSLAARLSSGARRSAEGLDWGVILPRWSALLDSLVVP